jgi:hypothetical protein
MYGICGFSTVKLQYFLRSVVDRRQHSVMQSSVMMPLIRLRVHDCRTDRSATIATNEVAIAAGHDHHMLDFDGTECLPYQIESVCNIPAERVNIMDFAGRLIECDDHIHDIRLRCSSSNSGEESDGGIEMYEASIWAADSVDLLATTCTSCLFLPAAALIQPGSRIVDTTYRLCSHCQQYVDPSLLGQDGGTSSGLDPFSCQYETVRQFGLIEGPPHDRSEPVATPLQLFLKRLYLARAIDAHAQSRSGLRAADQQAQNAFIARLTQGMQITLLMSKDDYRRKLFVLTD